MFRSSHPEVFVKRTVLQENIRARVSFLNNSADCGYATFTKRDTDTGVFLHFFVEFALQLFCVMSCSVVLFALCLKERLYEQYTTLLLIINVGSTLYFILLKNGQTYFKKLAVFTPQDF